MDKDKQLPKLRITYENHGRTNIAELPWDASLPEVVRKFAHLLEINGWSRDQIADLMTDGEQTVWEWEI